MSYSCPSSTAWSFQATAVPPSSMQSGLYSLDYLDSVGYHYTLTIPSNAKVGDSVSFTYVGITPSYTPNMFFTYDNTTGLLISYTTNLALNMSGSSMVLSALTDATAARFIIGSLSQGGSVFYDKTAMMMLKATGLVTGQSGGSVTYDQSATDPADVGWNFVVQKAPPFTPTSLPSNMLYQFFQVGQQANLGSNALWVNSETKPTQLAFAPATSIMYWYYDGSHVFAFIGGTKWYWSVPAYSNGCPGVETVAVVSSISSAGKWILAQDLSGSNQCILYDATNSVCNTTNTDLNNPQLMCTSNCTFASSQSGLPYLSMQPPSSPTSIASGTYYIKVGNQCLNVDGSLGTCNSDTSSIWIYDSTSHTITNYKNNTQCVGTQLSADCTSGLAQIGVMPCSTTANVNRFILGNGEIYDTKCNICFTNPAPITESYVNCAKNWIFQDTSGNSQKHGSGWAILFIILGLLILGIMAYVYIHRKQS